jgi:hypothetical protein
MNEVSTTATSDTRITVEELEPGRCSIKVTPPLDRDDATEFLRCLEAEYPQFRVLDVVSR